MSLLKIYQKVIDHAYEYNKICLCCARMFIIWEIPDKSTLSFFSALHIFWFCNISKGMVGLIGDSKYIKMIYCQNNMAKNPLRNKSGIYLDIEIDNKDVAIDIDWCIDRYR